MDQRSGRHMAEMIASVLLIVIAMRGASTPSGYPGPSAGIVTLRWATTEALDQLGTVWYYAYGFEGPDDRHHHRVFLVPPHYDESRAEAVLRSSPGRWWMVGNEPNDPFQDNLSPTAYAAFYHRFSRLARRTDPAVRLMPAGIANADWQWAEQFRESYRAMYGRYPRVDAWNVHSYVLDPNLTQLDQEAFQRQIIDFRAWMARSGEGGKALVLSEFGVLMGLDAADARYEPPSAITAYIAETVAWLEETGHIQSYAWFADHSSGLFNGDLYDDQGTLGLYGDTYRATILSLSARPHASSLEDAGEP